MTTPTPATGAEALLMSLKANGIDYLFGNAGNDFAPIIEAFVAKGATGLLPTPLTIPHETATVGMAHGYYLMTGRPQAAMVHVHVGLANATLNLINAASDNIPVVMMAGRTPLTEHDRPGARLTQIQYGQEVYDQTALVRGITKFDYELRYPEQAASLPTRAVTIAMSEPRGPVYLGLPREPLCEPWPDGVAYAPPNQAQVSPAGPDSGAIDEAAALLARAERPLVIAQRGDPAGLVGGALSALASDCALPVVEFMPIRNTMAADDPMLLGYAIAEPLAEADVVLVVDAVVPWIERHHRPATGKTIIHLGPDPLFQRMPVRSFQSDLAIAGDPALSLEALRAALIERQGDVTGRRTAIAERTRDRLAKARKAAERGSGSPMGAAWIARCLSDAMDDDAVVINELGVPPGAMDLKGPNRFFASPYAGGLGLGMTAALGAQLADRDRLTIACIGDGSYIFANPVACHQIAEAHDLPILTVVKNNGAWNAVRQSTLDVHPDGAAASLNARMPFVSLEPSPAYTEIAAASRAHVERVEAGADLPGALARAIEVIRSERRQAMLELKVELSDAHL